MNRWLAVIALTSIFNSAHAQITITAADMPVAGDTLRYSNVNALGATISTADSGAGMTWAYDLVATSQGVDTYKTGAQVNPLYFTTIPATAAGIKVADSIPGISLLVPGISISNIYTFYDKLSSPPSYIAESFAAAIVGIPIAANYTMPDAIYFFPLTYNRHDSSNYAFHFNLLTAGSIKQSGYRKTSADGWGTITTPYYTTPVNCLRVRSELHEVDSVNFGGNDFGLPRVTAEYKWLINGEHYPALIVTSQVLAGNEVPTQIRYRDAYRPDLNTTAVTSAPATNTSITAYPNPTANGLVNLSIPASWTGFYVELFDAMSRPVGTYKNQRELDMHALPSGNYVARITSGTGTTAFVQIVR